MRLVRALGGASLALTIGSACSAEVALAGMIGNRAVLVVDGGEPQTIAVGGRTQEGVKLIALDGDMAKIEFRGRRDHARLGERVVSAGGTEGDGLVLQADSRGHFFTRALVNEKITRFLVDTGATLVSLGRGDAERAGIDYVKGTPALSNTANGTVRVWLVRVATLEVGGVKVFNVEAAVHEQDLPVNLLGMSFLNRMQWQRNGDTLVMKRRY